MLPHQERVVKEKEELDERLRKLKAFFKTPLYQTISHDETVRLRNQADVMQEYSDILTERINHF